MINIDTSKASGGDNVNAALIKYSASSIYEHVTYLFNLCLSSGSSPHEWRVHEIRPILKNGDPLNCQNYRPISLLCSLSRVL